MWRAGGARITWCASARIERSDDDSLPDLGPGVSHGDLSSSCRVPAYPAWKSSLEATRREQNCVCQHMGSLTKDLIDGYRECQISREDCDGRSSAGWRHHCDVLGET